MKDLNFVKEKSDEIVQKINQDIKENYQRNVRAKGSFKISNQSDHISMMLGDGKAFSSRTTDMKERDISMLNQSMTQIAGEDVFSNDRIAAYKAKGKSGSNRAGSMSRDRAISSYTEEKKVEYVPSDKSVEGDIQFDEEDYTITMRHMYAKT
jgi:predicted  nucleic acid-binding Zn-ribbon protein